MFATTQSGALKVADDSMGEDDGANLNDFEIQNVTCVYIGVY